MLNTTLKYGFLVAAIATSTSALANDHTVSVGYANVKVADIKLKGVNAKYRYEFGSPVSVVASATHASEKQDYYFVDQDGDDGEGTEKLTYSSLLVGPAYRFNDYVSLYGLVGIAKASYKDDGYWYDYVGTYNYKESKTAFAYGVGVEVNPIENLAVSVGYEGSKVLDERAKGFNVTVGYKF